MNRTVSALVILAVALASCRKLVPPLPPVSDDPVQEVSADPSRDPEPPRETTAPAGEYLLPLIETTDMHGHIVETGEDAVHYRLAYIADKVEDYRAAGTDRLLLLDGGDLYQGASISNLTSGWPVYVSMDIMGYDAVALGNHEFDWGFENVVDADATLPDYERDGVRHVCEVPVVCANLYRYASRVEAVKDYVIVEKTAVDKLGNTVPVRIGIVGFAPDYSGSILSTQFSLQGYSIKEDYALANTLAGNLEESGLCDATILLVHGAADECARKLGEGSPIDFVAGGHTHQTKAGRTSWGLPYIQGGRYCEHYGYAELRFSVDGQGGISFSGTNKLVTRTVDSSRDLHQYSGQNAYELSGDILSVSDYALDLISQSVNDVLGYIDTGATTYYIDGSGGRASAMGNWMCDILRRAGGADAAFINAGGIRTSIPLGGSPQRNITVADIYEIFPFGNHIYVYDISWAELLQVFEYSMTSGGSSMFSYMTGVDCRFTSTDHGTYSTYAVRSLSKDGILVYDQGRWTDDWADRRVRIATSEYLATTERTDYYTDIPNPLPLWNGTSRLVDCSLVDNESAVRVLRAEAAASGGRLEIDTAPHMILVDR